jgi:putative heme-binding domain-containing protein
LLAVGLIGGDFQATAWAAEGRVPWTQSRIVGSPEPPLPLVLERVFTKLDFDKPVSIHAMPGAKRLVVCEQRGKIFSFPVDSDPERADLMVDFNETRPPLSEIEPGDKKRIEVFSFAFHPQFELNHQVVICYVVQGGGPRLADGTHIASFELSPTAPFAVKLETERTILRFDAGGHNGCTVAFDNDGLLYISTGDVASPSPPDIYNHGQNVGDIYSAILRVDMDRPAEDLGYSIPPDNPFVNLPGARPEVYAYGFRNPWRMSFDRHTGDLWVGDVGWEAWEMIYRVQSGGNYGWPIKEGPGDTRPDVQPGPTPILPADIALSHSDAASVTGGVVYRGNQLPEIHGQYVFGDWVTRRFWAATFDQQSVLSFREIAVGPVKPIAFELDHDGELLILDYNSAGTSGIYRFAPNPAPQSDEPFPTRLSETGLVSSIEPLLPAPGVVPYRVTAQMWRDGATVEHWLAIPGTGQATFYQQPQTMFDWFRTRVILPAGSVLVSTYYYDAVAGDAGSRRPIETQIAHNIALADWNYYTYRWRDDRSDADLVAPGGELAHLEITDPAAPDGKQRVHWSFAARSQCRTCHTVWRGEALGFTELQLRRPNDDADSWRELLETGYVMTDAQSPSKPNDQVVSVVDPYDHAHPLDLRARSYLHANCAHCHLQGGNSSAAFDVSFEKSLTETGLVNTQPMRGNVHLDEAQLVAAGDPGRSVLLYRMAKLGSGRMPPIAASRVDHAGVDLISRWIETLQSKSPQVAAATATQHQQWLRQLSLSDATDSGVDASQATALAAEQLLQRTNSALLLAVAIAGGEVDPQHHQAIVEQAMQSPPHIAELFEAWADDSKRRERLGEGFDPQQILRLAGDAKRGHHLFRTGHGQCSQCHQIRGEGLAVGPDLSKIGAKFPQDAELLRHIIDPAAEIAEPYRAITLLTTDGQAYHGRVLQRTETLIELQDAAGRMHRIELNDVELEKPSDQSLMPTQLLDSFTAQQAADLIAFLSELK